MVRYIRIRLAGGGAGDEGHAAAPSGVVLLHMFFPAALAAAVDVAGIRRLCDLQPPLRFRRRHAGVGSGDSLLVPRVGGRAAGGTALVAPPDDLGPN